MKTRLNVVGILPLACILFAALALVCVSCTGSYSDPDAWAGNSGSDGDYDWDWDDDDDDDDNDTGSSSSKPTALSFSATASEALAKLNAIIAYSGTPSATRISAQGMKDDWSTIYSPNWASMSISTIGTINAYIVTIP